MKNYKHLANSMGIKCKENGLHVRKEDVRLNIKELDPRGVELRGTRRLRHLVPKVLGAHGIVSGVHQIVFFFWPCPLRGSVKRCLKSVANKSVFKLQAVQ